MREKSGTMTSMKTLTAALALAALAALVGTTPAQATRPVPGYDYPDVCKNRGPYAMPGVQTVLDLPSGRISYVFPDQEPNTLGRRACEAREVRK